MALSLSSRITLAEGFSYLHRKVSLLNVFHAIQRKGLPGEEHDFVVLFECFGLKGDNHLLSLEIVHEAEGFIAVAEADGQLEVGEVPEAAYAIVPFEGITFPSEGRYNVIASVDGEYAGQWPLAIKGVS